MRRYSKYKDSGIEWLGEIPEEWKVKKLKHITENLDNVRVPLSAEERGEIQGSYPYYGATGIIDYVNDYLFDGEYLLIGEDGAPFFIENEDVSFIAKGKFWVNNHAHILKILGNNDIQFIMHTLNRVDYKGYITGSTRDKLTQSCLSDIVISFPSVPEQQGCSNYLNQKTNQIDHFIKKKQIQIDLLKEYRTAIINEAVTKGLNPDVKMKDSGIEWIGEIPEHWEIKKLKFISKIRYGLGQPPRQMEGGLPLIRATNIERGKITEKDLILVDPEDIPYDRDPILKTNDIIVVRSGAYTADSAIVTEKYDGSIIGYDLVVKANGVNPKLIAFALLSDYVLINQLFLNRLRAAQPHLNAEELGEALILIPPSKNEQVELVDYLSSETSKIDQTISGIQNQVSLLQQYRTSLISEVVTGKIDVRDEVQ